MNIFQNIPIDLSNEIFEDIFLSPNLKIERIVSDGHSSPNDFWYDQDQNEWVIVLQGSAELEFEDKTISLVVGDYELIPSHKKHRVASTSSIQPTIWLAIHF